MRQSSPRRRDASGCLLAILLTVAAMSGCTGSSRDPASGHNPIVLENQKQGTASWRIDQRPSDDIAKQIKGYASATSVNIGDTITLFVTVNPVQTYAIDIYRIGYYQGLGGRLMRRVGSLGGSTQAGCPMDATTGMITCRWSPSYQLSVPRTWTSGVYLAKLTSARLYQNYIIFVVRDDDRTAALLYQQSVNTYQAYNDYPDDAAAGSPQPATGKSLYEGGSSSSVTGLGTTRALKVSFDRPYAADDGAGDFLEWEIYYVRWLEQSGYDVNYSTDVDTHTNGGRLLTYKGFLSVGHDEYWSRSMYDTATAARDAGVSLGFFGANAIYWQVRYEPSPSGVPNRVMVCYKDADLDPVHGPTVTVRWRDRPLNRPEQRLIGVQFTSEQPDKVAPARYVATNTSNALYAGTGMHEGDSIAGIVGYEADSRFPEVPLPAYVPDTYTLLSRSPYVNMSGTTTYQNSVIYQAGSGAWVFGAGSIEWSWGLYDDSVHSHADPRIQRITAQILNRFLLDRAALPATPTNLRVQSSGGSVRLIWTDNATDANNVILERSAAIDFDAVTSITLPRTATTYADSGLRAGVYYYRVRTVDTTGSSPYSNVVGVATISYDALVNGRVDLISRWRLAETGGTTAVDSAGVDNGSYVAGVRFGVAGAVANDPNTAITLNGSSGDIRLPSLPPVTDFSIEGWTRLGTHAIANSNGNNAMYGAMRHVRLLVRPGTVTAAYAGVWLGGVEYALQPDTSVSNLGDWVQWVLTRSGGVLTLYRDGSRIAQRTDLPVTTAADISGWIGAQDGREYFLNGSIDELSIYRGALSPTDVANHYTAAISGPTP